ncbi:hypothetical protein [Streptomyces sp. NPDC058614]|uniref:hypothetical protein n=1 Tax=Streptomyces sp. NPDC058614 TaxID=3346557 RepID=UPI00364D527E
MLDSHSHAVHQAEAAHRCQYGADHSGQHVALAQSQDYPAATSTAWWTRWPVPHTQGYEIKVIEECPASGVDSNDDALFLHPIHHPGGHWW